MSDDERGLSDDDCTDLFDSEPEDQDSGVGHSVDLSVLSMNARTLFPPENYVDNSATINEAEYEESFHQEDISVEVETRRINFAGLGADQLSRSIENVDIEKDVTSEEDVGMNYNLIAISRCESPRISEPVALQDSADKKEFGDAELQFGQENEAPLDRNRTPCSNSQTHELNVSIPIDNCSEEIDQTSAKCFAQKSLQTEADQIQRTLETDATDSSIDRKLSPRASLEERTEILKRSSPDPLTIAASAYTVESLFPVVYESEEPSSVSQCQRAQVVPLSKPSMRDQIPSRGRRKQQHGSNPDKSIASRLATLQSQLDVAHSTLANATRVFKLQLSMSESDNKKLSQRNTRLKNQLSVVTANLQRSNTEMAKLKTENELYAAKLPQLQTELLQETSQVDETQACSVQTQLALSQLKARSQVLQTRNLVLETQNSKLTQQLRECQQQFQRKVTTLQQQSEKTAKMESEMNDMKNTHWHDKLEWKNRMTSALQRFEREKNKLEAEWKTKERKELREAKERAEKATKKRRTAEFSAAKLEEQLKHHKHELLTASDTVQRSANEIRTLELLLRKTHRTEATLRNDLAACKTRLRSLQDEMRRRSSRLVTVPTTRRRLEGQIPVEMLLPLSDSSDDEDDNQQSSCCSCCLTSLKTIESSLSSPVCSDCPALRNQLCQLREELVRVRALHSAELHAQASVLDALLCHQGQFAVAPM